jgi:tetratricopeptide (TPR) repeat protein
MARRLNKRLLAYLLIFVGVPLAVLIIAMAGGWFSTGNPQPYFEEAQALVQDENWGQAWIAIRDAIRHGGGRDPEIQFLFGQIAIHQTPQPAVTDAIRAYQTVIALKPDHLEARRNLVEILLAVRSWSQAKAEVDTLIKMDPTFGKAYLWAGAVELGLAESENNLSRRAPYYEAAIARCRQGIEQDPGLLDLYRLMAAAYDRLGQDDKVNETVDLLLAKNPKRPEAYIMKAQRLATLRKMDEAEQLLEKALVVIGADASIYSALGDVAISKRNPDAAREFFSKAIATDPKIEATYIRLAGLYRMENQRPQAIETLAQGLVQLPQSVPLRAEQADVYLEIGDVAKADERMAEIEKATPNPDAPDTAVLLYLKGKRALRKMEVRPAIDFLEQARDKWASPQTRLLLGRAYMLAGELGAAQRELKALVSPEEQPGLVAAWRTLAVPPKMFSWF